MSASLLQLAKLQTAEFALPQIEAVIGCLKKIAPGRHLDFGCRKKLIENVSRFSKTKGSTTFADEAGKFLQLFGKKVMQGGLERSLQVLSQSG